MLSAVEGKLEGLLTFFKPEEGGGNNRSVMPLDVPGCTRATMIIAVSILPSSCAQLFCYHSMSATLTVVLFVLTSVFMNGSFVMLHLGSNTDAFLTTRLLRK